MRILHHQEVTCCDQRLAGAWKGAKELGVSKPLHNRELRSYPQVSKQILEDWEAFSRKLQS